jgi:hypothetical protein
MERINPLHPQLRDNTVEQYNKEENKNVLDANMLYVKLCLGFEDKSYKNYTEQCKRMCTLDCFG